jgi:glycosyltransferase involved in cell wall biosynthesis
MDTRPLKIAAIGMRGMPSSYSGIERSCESLYTRLASRGHQITVYCRNEYVTSRPQYYNGIRLQSAPAIRRKSFETLSHVAASLVHALVRERYNIIHLHALAPGIFSRWCRSFRIPTVATVQGLDWQRAKWKGGGAIMLKAAERSLVANANRIIVVSRDLQTYFKKQYDHPTYYIPNGIGTFADSKEQGSSVLADFAIEPGQYVLYLARLVPEKRVHDLINAFRETTTPMRLVIAGEGGFTDGYVAQLKALASSDPRILFTGFQQKPAVEALFRNAALYVLPSELEGLPLSLLECIEAGTPAIVSDIPPHRELLGCVDDYDLFFPAGDVPALRAKLQTALAGLERYREIAREIRSHVRFHYGWDSIVEETERLYYSALSPANAASGNAL